MKIAFLNFVFLAILMFVGMAHAEETYIEPGRYGFEWAVTEDTVFIGPTYRSDNLEAAFFISGHQYSDGAPANVELPRFVPPDCVILCHS